MAVAANKANLTDKAIETNKASVTFEAIEANKANISDKASELDKLGHNHCGCCNQVLVGIIWFSLEK